VHGWPGRRTVEQSVAAVEAPECRSLERCSYQLPYRQSTRTLSTFFIIDRNRSELICRFCPVRQMGPLLYWLPFSRRLCLFASVYSSRILSGHRGAFCRGLAGLCIASGILGDAILSLRRAHFEPRNDGGVPCSGRCDRAQFPHPESCPDSVVIATTGGRCDGRSACQA
jgi:hypothetical protein